MTNWTIREQDLKPKDANVLSSIFCVGNGHICTRGTLSEENLGAFRGVYMSGLYTLAPWGIDYYLAAPDWLPAFVLIDGQRPDCTASSLELDMRDGILRRIATFERNGTVVEVLEQRLASFARSRVMAQQFTVRRVAGNADVDVMMGLDGDIRQSRAKYYSEDQYPCCDKYGIRLSAIEELSASAKELKVVMRSGSTKRRTCARAVARMTAGPAVKAVASTTDGKAMMRWRLSGKKAEGTVPCVFEKLAVITADITDRENATSDGKEDLAYIVKRSYEAVLADHTKAIRSFWDMADVEIDGDSESQRAIRYAVWITRSSAPDDDGFSSIGAKNLTGDWYRGGVFWDMEIYQLPMLAVVAPRLARNHILYRIKRLNASRRLAAQDGYRGARYVGTSYETGLENPPSTGGLGLMEIHTSYEVVWGIRHYYAMTNDTAMMLNGGLEVVLEVANFWSSKVRRDPDGTFHLRSICGPDELHKPVDDNAYTNRMIVELLTVAPTLISKFRKISGKRVDALLRTTGVDKATLAHWRAVAEGLHVPTVNPLVFDQYTGHAAMPEPNPRLLKEAGMGADKIAKQADTLMLFQNIPWEFSHEQMAANYREFAPLCNQTSSLSLCSHALVAANLGYERDACYYMKWAGGVDLDDTMGNTAHGVHGAGEGGIWLVVVGGFGGLRVTPATVKIDPRLPKWWKRLRYRFYLAGAPVEVDAMQDSFTVSNLGKTPVSLTIKGKVCRIAAGAKKSFDNRTAWQAQTLEGVVVDVSRGDRDLSELAALCRRLKEQGVRCAAYSADDSGPTPVEMPELKGVLDAVADRQCIRAFKPDPQGFLTATQRIRVLPWNSIGIVFDAAGVEAVRRAGMLSVGIGAGAAQADLAVSDPANLTVEQMKALLASKTLEVNPYLERNIAIAKSEARGK